MTNNVAESQNKLIQEDFGKHHKELDMIATKLKERMEFWSREYEREANGIIGRRQKRMAHVWLFYISRYSCGEECFGSKETNERATEI